MFRGLVTDTIEDIIKGKVCLLPGIDVQKYEHINDKHFFQIHFSQDIESYRIEKELSRIQNEYSNVYFVSTSCSRDLSAQEMQWFVENE